MGAWLERDHQREDEAAILTELPTEIRAQNQRLNDLEDTVSVIHDGTKQIFDNTKAIFDNIKATFNNTREILQLVRGRELTYEGLNPQDNALEGEEEGRIGERSR